MSSGRHSYVAFYPSDWTGGTARMTRLHKSVYFDVCCYIWDKAEPCPVGELPLMLGDLPNWRDLVEDLVAAGKLVRSPDGSIVNCKALNEARKALDLWEKKSKGGKDGAEKTNRRKSPVATPDSTPDATPADSPDESGPGVPTQNQNQNQNQIEEGTTSSPPTQNVSRETSDDEFLNLPAHLRAPVVNLATKQAKRTRLMSWDIKEGDEHVAYARECGMDNPTITVECEKFENHHKAAGSLMADWGAAWKKWCRNWQSYGARRAV